MRMRRRQFVAACGALWVQATIAAQAHAFPFGPPNTLEDMARRIEREFPDVAHMRTGELVSQSANAFPLRLFDVRESGEFEVGHLSGAERVAPNASTRAALRQIGARAEGAIIVFYCSVGQRSSRLAARTQRELQTLGARALYNLRGGVFAWHNDARPLVDRFGATPYVHPYSEAWRSLLAHPRLTAFHARTAAQ